MHCDFSHRSFIISYHRDTSKLPPSPAHLKILINTFVSFDTWISALIMFLWPNDYRSNNQLLKSPETAERNIWISLTIFMIFFSTSKVIIKIILTHDRWPTFNQILLATGYGAQLSTTEIMLDQNSVNFYGCRIYFLLITLAISFKFLLTKTLTATC